MNKATLLENIRSKRSFLCVGLDTDPEKIPPHLHQDPDPIFSFNKAIIDATLDYTVAYKPNTAFYEAQGIKGWKALQKTMNYLTGKAFVIADAKRGDIGNTGKQYARAFFQTLNADAVTVAPYMGKDSVQPFLEDENKWAVVLGLTSNSGSQDFQHLMTNDGPLYQEVLKKVSTWGNPENLMFVVGATQAESLQKIRAILPDHFLLVPGVGAQGGSLEKVCEFGINKDIGLLINSSRGIIYADSGVQFADAAKTQARMIQEEMKRWIVN